MPAGIFTAATDLGNTPEESGAYMSIVVFGQYIGMFLGPLIYSFSAEYISWSAASYFLIAVSLFTLLTAILNKDLRWV